MSDIVTAIEREVALMPDAIAVASGDKHVSYDALNREANRMARGLIEGGVNPECIVGVALECPLDQLSAMLGILKSGATYLPLDVSAPPQRVEIILHDALPACVITTTAIAQALASSAVRCVTYDEVRARSEVNVKVNPMELHRRAATTEDSAAYLIYTSGSTGKPKGVVVPHRGVPYLAAYQARIFDVTCRSRILQFADWTFDASISEIMMALTTGACFVACDDRKNKMRTLARDIALKQITHVTVTPAVLPAIAGDDIRSLTVLIVAGESVGVGPLVHCRAPRRRIFNAYGPTEATVCATVGEWTHHAKPPTIGQQMDDVRVKLLDDRLCEVGPGTIGELYIAGPTLARGYLRHASLSAASFVANPDGHGDRMYRTGDCARVDSDGNLDFVGRGDQQVKIHGYRIELGEVENILESDADVDRAVVTAEPGTDGVKQLHAFVRLTNRVDATEWWPSTAEHSIYDDVLYIAMANDRERNAAYHRALVKQARGKLVVDVGTGPLATLARLAVDAGARHVYALEIQPRAYQQAVSLVTREGLEDRITVLLGDIRTASLPVAVDLCVSELVGPIAGMEGVVPILADIGPKMTASAGMIPRKATTRIAAVTLPGELRERPSMEQLAARYTERIFDSQGRRFDLRLCIRHLPQDCFLSSDEACEELSWPSNATNYPEIELVVERTGRCDGFLMWLVMSVDQDDDIDIRKHQHCWLPVFVPVSLTDTRLSPGDRIQLKVTPLYVIGRVQPDYRLEGWVHRSDGGRVRICDVSSAVSEQFRGAPVYRNLFDDCGAPACTAQRQRRVEAIRSRVRQVFPSYMNPATLTCVDEWPLTESGKIDRAGLARLVSPGRRESCGGEITRTVSEVVAELLNRMDINAESDFFHMGGDSILAIMLVSRLLQMGLPLEVHDVFEARTIAEIAQRVRQPNADPCPSNDSGSVMATPIFRWLEERGGPLSGYVQAVVVRAPAGCPKECSRQLFQALIDNHDVLRMRAVRINGRMEYEIGPVGAVRVENCLSYDVSPGATLADSINETIQSIASGLNPETGPMLRVVWHDSTRDPHAHLILVAHHLAIDGVSWRILIDDLRRMYQALESGEAVRVAPARTSFRAWAAKLNQIGASGQRRGELDYWVNVYKKGEQGQLYPGSQIDKVRDTFDVVRSRSVILSPEASRTLLRQDREVERLSAADLLLAGLVLATAIWRGREAHEVDALLVEVEGHGREQLWPDIDLTRTVGWFTTAFPVCIPFGAVAKDALKSAETLYLLARDVAAAMRQAPQAGIGYGVLRYLDPVASMTLAHFNAPQVSFNYLGRYAGDERRVWTVIKGTELVGAAPCAMPMAHLLELTVIAFDDPYAPEVTANWRWVPSVVSESDADVLIREWCQVMELLALPTPQPSLIGPADVTLVPLTQNEIDSLLAGD